MSRERQGGSGRSAPTVKSVTFDLLRAFGIDRVFGNPGSTELAFLHDWPTDIDYVLGLQEASVVAMADGYAQAMRNAAFINLHSAAGVGHSLGNLFTAFRNQTPLVITAGQQSRSLLPMQPFLYAEQAPEFPKPYVKWSVEPARAEDVPAAIARAYYIAMTPPRGPCFVSVPSDDWNRPAAPVQARRVSREIGPVPGAVADLADAIAAARKPAFIVGPSVDREGVVDLMVQVAERARAAIWASPFSMRASFPERHPLFSGFLHAGPEMLTAALAPYDLVVVFGAPVFTFHVEGRAGIFESGTPIWQVTDNPTDAAIAPVGTSILSSMRPALAELLACLGDSDREPPPPRAVARQPEASEPITAEYLLHRLSEALPPNAIVVEEAPSHRPAMHKHFPMRGQDSFYTMSSGGLGYSLPASVGISMARPGKRVLCLLGDGSAMYSIQALWTAAQHNLPITFVILNNSGYGAMRSFSRIMQAENPPGIDLPGLDFVQIARGHGCEAMRVTKPDEIGPALHKAFADEGPVVLDIAVDQDIPVLYHGGEERPS
jgi:benzoylformate decarboxylase